MVHHIVCWNFKEGMTAEEKQQAGEIIKQKLEEIKPHAHGAVSIEVKRNELASSNRDLALLSVFETVEDLNGYQVHPMHVEAGKYIKSVTCDRTCFDYEE
ncbi:MAG: Dabb family protein [Lachnospiraceae bacterium]|nr:Dabb family protein [Lachnospiraceae bacterium]